MCQHQHSFEFAVVAIAETVLEALKSVMSESTRNSLAVYGFNRAEWQQALMKEITVDQLPPEYGGVKGRQPKQ